VHSAAVYRYNEDFLYVGVATLVGELLVVELGAELSTRYLTSIVTGIDHIVQVDINDWIPAEPVVVVQLEMDDGRVQVARISL
jgi:hypothetical protein